MLAVPNAVISRACRAQNKVVSVDDVIIVNNMALQIRACVETDALLLIAKVFGQSHNQFSGHCWRQTDANLKVVYIADMVFTQPAYWTFLDQATLLTLE